MSDLDFTAEDYQESWNDWYETYEIGEYIENSEENFKKVQEMDPHYVWTSHSTCEDEQVTNGVYIFDRCCWETFGWYVGKKPWEGDPETHFESYNASAYLPCTICNPDGEEEEGFNEECEECNGDGWATHFFD